MKRLGEKIPTEILDQHPVGNRRKSVDKEAMKALKTVDSQTGGKELCDRFLASASQVIFSKEKEFKLALICFLAKGHLLIEDVPGVGKTTFVKTMAKLLNLAFSRIQFTNDLLPSDIIGISIFNKDRNSFEFHKGPIFSDVVLIDELNRATPKTQSALLQAMEERQVTVDGKTHPLPNNFFIAATQNPHHQVGTFPLPESQLDRFTMRIKLGFPDPAAEKKMILSPDGQQRLDVIHAIMSPQALESARQNISQIFVSEDVASYVQSLLHQSRTGRKDMIPLSPRTGMALIAAAKAHAYLDNRLAVFPEDVQFVFHGVVNHRIAGPASTLENAEKLTTELINAVRIE